MLDIEKINQDINEIKKWLENLKKETLSNIDKKTKIEELKNKAEAIKQKIQLEINNLKNKIDTVSTKKVEEAKILLNSSNETINLAISILNNIKSQPTKQPQATEAQVTTWWNTTSKKASDWIKEQWNATTRENFKKEPWVTSLRAIWFWLTWYAIVKWVKWLRNKVFWNKEESDNEWDSESESTSKEEPEKKSFWESWRWKFFKWTGIWTWAYYIAHWVKTGEWSLSNLFSRKNKEKDNSTSNEKFKCKWWEYLWIDISSHNGSIDLNSFMNWNRVQRDSADTQKRWISLMYIRASDNITSDNRVSEHVNNICNYNGQVGENEKIAVWFYHRLSWGDWKAQADKFIETYNKQSWKLWWKKLIPMVDVEDWGSGGWVTQARNSNNKEKVRSNTLNWINYVEKNLGITPWIYASDSVNKAFFWDDSRFNKYKKRIARYWSKPDQADMHQYSKKWKIWWLNHPVDLNSTSNVEQFLA